MVEYETRFFRHAGISLNAAAWQDGEIEDCIRLMKGWQHPDAPATVEAFKTRAAELRAKGYECFPACDTHDKRGVCTGHQELVPRWGTQSESEGKDG